MDFSEVVVKRRSIRKFRGDVVPDEVLDRVLEAGRWAPSAGNSQPWHFIVVKNREKREALAKGGRYAKFLAESPVAIVGCGDQKASPNWYAVDVAIAMQNMVLTATAEGLGTCWVGSFSEERVKSLLKIPERYRVVALLALGYRREKLELTSKVLHFIRRKKSLEKIVSYDEFGKNR